MRAKKNQAIAVLLDEEVVVGGVIIPAGETAETVKKHVRRARIVSSRIHDVHDGDIVIYSRFSGIAFTRDGLDYVLFDDDDIDAIAD